MIEGNLKCREEIETHISNIQPGKCEVCDNWLLHIKNAEKSRSAYRTDADTYPDENVFHVSADMQKVIMLPSLPGVKTAVFTRRITMYHETFAPLMPSKEVKKQWIEDKKKIRKLKPLGMIWHEGIQGRCDEDVASSVVKFLRHPDYRSAKKIIIWADNCVGQLKNWTFYSALVYEVNHGYSVVTVRLASDILRRVTPSCLLTPTTIRWKRL